MSNPKMISLFYNPTKKISNCIDYGCTKLTTIQICGNSKLQVGEQCDNGNNTGCSSNCVPDLGYSCTGDIEDRSICATICGDGIRASNEQCDNGNKIGCFNCKLSPGWNCTGNLGSNSSCSQKCGDGIKTEN